MKKRILAIAIALCMCFTLLPLTAFAEDGIAINAANFPDETFRNYVKTNFDTSYDNKLSAEECAAATTIVLEYKKITSLEGIEYFTALEWLMCSGNALTELDVSNNPALTILWCSNNMLTELDVSKNTALTTLLCNSTDITELDVSNNPALTILMCYDNELTELDVSNNPALTTLACYSNKIPKLDLSRNTKLSARLSMVSTQTIELNVPLNGFDLAALVGADDLDRISSVEGGALNDGIISCTENEFTYYYDTASAVGSMQVILKSTAEDTGHTYGKPTYTWNGDQCTAEAKCTDEGCDRVMSETVTGQYVKDTDATCTTAETGHYEATFQIDLFVKQSTEADSATNGIALGHSYGDWIQTKEPTCTGSGRESRFCSRCTSHETRNVAPLGHDYGEWTVTTEPTCTEKGEEMHCCSRCEAFETREVDALGHDFGEWSVTLEPTCTEKGVATRYCSHCEAFETKEIDAVGHDYGEWTVTTEPTCTEKGEETRYCAYCEAFETREVDALGHDYHDGECTRCHEADPDFCPQDQFTDKLPEEHWAHSAIDYVLNRGIMHGMGDGTFAPNGTLTRAMVAVMLHNLSGEPEVSGDSPFTDVKLTDWYGEAVIWAYENKIVSGMGDGTFNPNGSITREQLAIMMQNYAAFIGKDTSGEDDLSRFEDAEDVSFWAEKEVKWAVSAGIISGSDEGGKLYLLPQGDATRAQIAVIFEGFCKAFGV